MFATKDCCKKCQSLTYTDKYICTFGKEMGLKEEVYTIDDIEKSLCEMFEGSLTKG